MTRRGTPTRSPAAGWRSGRHPPIWARRPSPGPGQEGAAAALPPAFPPAEAAQRLPLAAWQRTVHADRHGTPLVRYVAELELGPSSGPTRGVRLIAATLDPATLKPESTWYLATSLPLSEASAEQVYAWYRLREWIEHFYKPAKHELGWADYQLRPERAMVRHWQLVLLAYTFSLLVGALPTAAPASTAPDPSTPPQATGGEKIGPRPYPRARGPTHARPRRSVSFQMTRSPDSTTWRGGPDFSPGRCALWRIGCRWGGLQRGLQRGGGALRQRAHEQTEGVGEHHQLPMAHNCSLGAHLVVGPAQFMLDWLVVVLDPIPQAVDLIDLLGADLRGGQRRRQIPGGFGLQVRWVQGGRNQTHAPSRAIGGSEFEFDEVAHQLFPMAVEAHRALPGVEWQTRSRFGGGEGGGMGLIFHPLPHPMRGAQSHHIRDLGSEQLAFQRGILAIDGVGDDHTEGDARRARLLDQVPRQRRLGVEVGIFAALRQSTGRPIGPHAQGHMTAAVCPLARHRHHAIGHMPQLAQILLGGEHNPVTALGIARLIDDEQAARIGALIRMRL